MSQKKNSPSIGDILDKRSALKKFLRSRSNDYETKTIKLDKSIPQGWVLERELKTSKRIRKEKQGWKKFEDKIWRLFYNFEFDELNKDYEPGVYIGRGESRREIRFDVIAKADNFILFVECKTKEKRKMKSIRQIINDLHAHRNGLRKLVENYYDPITKEHLRVEFILATQNIVISPQDRELARKKRVFIWEDKSIGYIELLSKLSKTLGSVARYQLYSMMFRKDRHLVEPIRVPAVKHKVGNITYYSFLAKPEHLLKIAYVHRRGSGINKANEVTLTYQRMISETKIKEIRKYIENKSTLPFPNSIIINFDSIKNIKFEERPPDERFDIRDGVLTLPRYYGSAWIIDGQHRLFGYALSERKDKDLLPVIAFENLSESQQAQLFVDINQNQTAVTANHMWDLKEQLYEGTDDPAQLKEWIISRVGKKLASDKKSPLFNSIKVPSMLYLNSKAPLTLNTICATLLKSGVLSNDYIPINKNYPNRTVNILFNLLVIHLDHFRREFSNNWKLGKTGYFRSSNGAAAVIWLFRQVLHYLNYIEKSDFYRQISKHKEFNKIITSLFSPIIDEFKRKPNLSNDLRKMRGESGQKESANHLCFIIKYNIFPDFPLLQAVPKIPKGDELDDVDKLDLAIKQTELKIRNFVKERLKKLHKTQWYKKGVPGDAKSNIDEHIELEIKRNPYIRIETNDEKFNFVQLGDLKKIIESGTNWKAFDGIFKDKNNFGNKMKEYMDLRNALRGHPRPVDETQKNVGKAAMEWLNRCIDMGEDL